MEQSLPEGPPQIPIDLRALERRAKQYSRRCDTWLDARTGDGSHAIDHPIIIVRRLSAIVPAEIQRALAAWLSPDDEARELTADPAHAAEIAILAIELSRHAWLALVKEQQVGGVAAQPFVADLIWLKHEVERVFPLLPQCSIARFAEARSE
jgi:hypothetical protein